MKLPVVPVAPAVQLLPLLVLYSQVVVPPSSPVTLIRPLLVTPSVVLLPASTANAKVGANGPALSMVMAAGLLVMPDTLPARSVWRT